MKHDWELKPSRIVKQESGLFVLLFDNKIPNIHCVGDKLVSENDYFIITSFTADGSGAKIVSMDSETSDVVGRIFNTGINAMLI